MSRDMTTPGFNTLRAANDLIKVLEKRCAALEAVVQALLDTTRHYPYQSQDVVRRATELLHDK